VNDRAVSWIWPQAQAAVDFAKSIERGNALSGATEWDSLSYPNGIADRSSYPANELVQRAKGNFKMQLRILY
jgi:hypothetical protein